VGTVVIGALLLAVGRWVQASRVALGVIGGAMILSALLWMPSAFAFGLSLGLGVLLIVLVFVVPPRWIRFLATGLGALTVAEGLLRIADVGGHTPDAVQTSHFVDLGVGTGGSALLAAAVTFGGSWSARSRSATRQTACHGPDSSVLASPRRDHGRSRRRSLTGAGTGVTVVLCPPGTVARRGAWRAGARDRALEPGRASSTSTRSCHPRSAFGLADGAMQWLVEQAVASDAWTVPIVRRRRSTTWWSGDERPGAPRDTPRAAAPTTARADGEGRRGRSDHRQAAQPEHAVPAAACADASTPARRARPWWRFAVERER
jgi:hypothetical protein